MISLLLLSEETHFHSILSLVKEWSERNVFLPSILSLVREWSEIFFLSALGALGSSPGYSKDTHVKKCLWSSQDLNPGLLRGRSGRCH